MVDNPIPNQVDKLLSFRCRRMMNKGMMITKTIFVLIVICGLSGCATNETVSPSIGGKSSVIHPADSERHVDIFRGLGGYMSGRAQLQERLSDCGISSTTWLSAQSGQVAKQILDRRAGGDDSPIVLLGYAVGGGRTRQVATILKKHGVDVDATILIDPSFFEPVPSNVRYCFVAYRPEIWQKWNSIMRGNPVKAESDRTVVVQMNLTEEDQQGVLFGESHLTITSNDWVQEILVYQAAKETGAGR